MSLDTKYRPIRFDDVLGQDATIKILRRFISTGKGRHQSYLFCGPFGSGKTTLARILARALLCEHPTVEGDPCDQCLSCRSFLEQGASADFTEVDAATNSGKADIEKILESIQYDTFSGRRRVYLLDEAHALSTQALDALLKPLEENFEGTSEKRLVCLFCTTEPEKMRETIFSRCAPAFVVQPVTPDMLAERLKSICEKEGFSADPEMLSVIASMTECHIRDAIKAVEGLSMLGPITRETVTSYLHLDINDSLLELLDVLGSDLNRAFLVTKQALQKTSPAVCYEKLSELALLAFQTTLSSGTVPVYLDAPRLKQIGQRNGPSLLGAASRFASRPSHPTEAMLLCDIGTLHYGGSSLCEGATIVVAAPAVPNCQKSEISDVACPKVSTPVTKSVPISTPPGKLEIGPTRSGDPAILIPGTVNEGPDLSESRNLGFASDGMTQMEFGKLLGRMLKEELGRTGNGRKGFSNLGGN